MLLQQRPQRVVTKSRTWKLHWKKKKHYKQTKLIPFIDRIELGEKDSQCWSKHRVPEGSWQSGYSCGVKHCLIGWWYQDDLNNGSRWVLWTSLTINTLCWMYWKYIYLTISRKVVYHSLISMIYHWKSRYKNTGCSPIFCFTKFSSSSSSWQVGVNQSCMVDIFSLFLYECVYECFGSVFVCEKDEYE